MPPSQQAIILPADGTLDDSGLQCPCCDYNLTGLTEPRCPECGSAFDWDRVKLQREVELGGTGTPWEHWRWYLKPAAFLVTALEAAILPWRFARRLPAQPRIRWAIAFGAVCFAFLFTVPARCPVKVSELAVWALPPLACLLAQAAVFAILVPPRRTRRPFLFWLTVGLYLSYPVAIEWLRPDKGSVPVPVLLLGPETEATIWPFSARSSWLKSELLPTVLFYLWWADLVAVILVRCRSVPRWRLALAGFAVLPLTIGATYLGLLLMRLLDVL